MRSSFCNVSRTSTYFFFQRLSSAQDKYVHPPMVLNSPSLRSDCDSQSTEGGLAFHLRQEGTIELKVITSRNVKNLVRLKSKTKQHTVNRSP